MGKGGRDQPNVINRSDQQWHSGECVCVCVCYVYRSVISLAVRYNTESVLYTWLDGWLTGWADAYAILHLMLT